MTRSTDTSTTRKRADQPAPQTAAAPSFAIPPDEGRRRVVIEDVTPEIDAGRFPVKRTVGERVIVEADVFADGHDRLAAAVRFRYAGPDRDVDAAWSDAPMTAIENDRWRGAFDIAHVGWYEFTVEGWVDEFASWQHGLDAKVKAGQDVAAELAEGAALVRAAAARMPAGAGRTVLLERAASLESGTAAATRVALDANLLARVSAAPDRRLATTYAPVLRAKADRVRARVGAWYEMFPRAVGPDPARSATFAEAASELATIASMGFDVLYLPPIHPIGVTNRKGRGNTLIAGPGDPGSPWAIGAADGGHTAVESGLGTLDDFRAFRAHAEALGLEIALDLAYQASPDHPYVAAHPEWFRHRLDGSIKYAENPPKKYQDIYPFNFESDAWRPLWDELRDVVLFWVDHGVRIFRVDNPHTKPLRFWEWLIADVQARDPGVIFLSEAFTRPKVMKRLAKAGFTQSYTYFTWRNTKAELEAYLTELTTTEMREYFRPNFFANTPDILHAFLQRGGPAAFRIRLVLAATLAASYGIYRGFELCEGRAVPGTEEYLSSEKYQFQSWPRVSNRVALEQHQGNPVASPVASIEHLIATVNGIRRRFPAFAFDQGLRFHLTTSDQLIAYSKTAPGNPTRVLVVVALDPRRVQDGWVCASIPDDPIGDAESYAVRDLLTDRVYWWKGGWNYVRLDPAGIPAHVLLVERTP